MKFVKFKVPCFDVPDVIKEKLVCIDNLRKCLNKKNSKLYKAKIGALLQEEMCLAYCKFVDNLHSKLGVPESLFLFDAKPCEICAGIKKIKESLIDIGPLYGPEPIPRVGHTLAVIEEALLLKKETEEKSCQR